LPEGTAGALESDCALPAGFAFAAASALVFAFESNDASPAGLATLVTSPRISSSLVCLECCADARRELVERACAPVTGSFVEFTAICCLQFSPGKSVLSEKQKFVVENSELQVESLAQRPGIPVSQRHSGESGTKALSYYWPQCYPRMKITLFPGAEFSRAYELPGNGHWLPGTVKREETFSLSGGEVLQWPCRKTKIPLARLKT
jgi:hypothetical protein